MRNDSGTFVVPSGEAGRNYEPGCPVTALDGAKRFVMQYGSHARALAPEELREEIREELSRASELYANRKDAEDRDQ